MWYPRTVTPCLTILTYDPSLYISCRLSLSSQRGHLINEWLRQWWLNTRATGHHSNSGSELEWSSRQRDSGVVVITRTRWQLLQALAVTVSESRIRQTYILIYKSPLDPLTSMILRFQGRLLSEDKGPRRSARKCRPLGYERVYLPLWKVADIPFHIQGDDVWTDADPARNANIWMFASIIARRRCTCFLFTRYCMPWKKYPLLKLGILLFILLL